MSLFQTSVLKNHLSLLDKEVIEKAYKKYSSYFLNPTIQENIRSSKEEEYQGIFLTELFVNILEYTLKPKANFNLVAEYKNQTNARKADGAILHNDIALGVIELKGTNTKDLESIRKQAFDYKANQKGCVYVITSNFEKLRFYINDATEFEEFNLFELTKERFQLFFLCLQKDNLVNNLPLKIKEASIVQEEQITKDFYKDYSLFKRELFRDLIKNNAKRLKNTSLRTDVKQSVDEQYQQESQEQKQLEKNVKLTLFKKSQKLIDRFLFIFFAEDRNLLPANSTLQILEDWNKLKELDAIMPLYDRFKLYFKYLDEGRAGTNKKAEIYAYNGGLFKPDAILNSLLIDDELLYKHTQKLANYDFASQVDVNILGHIFENSLNEIESVNAEIEGAEFDKQKSKRKKDGVFYTPKYITKYIVENTVGKLCLEKKAELGIKEEEYFKGRKNRNKTTITRLVGLLDDYRDWLLQLTICDPACGSGAFLNQALNFLIAEHNYIDELKTKVLGGGLQFPDIENTILENNIFGVDLNEESVEIAKLSLWLRTAQPRRKLNDLSSNIKCGNSLIDSKAVAGDKAFSWENEFPQVFEKGGFDVIIGNPPYVDNRGFDKIELHYLYKNYTNSFEKSGTSKFKTTKLNLIAPFIELNSKILKNKGLISFIFHKNIYKTNSYTAIRKYIIENYDILNLTDWGANQFEDVVAETATFTLKKGRSNNDKIHVEFYNLSTKYKENIQTQSNFENAYEYIFGINLSEEDRGLLKRIEKNSKNLENFVNINNGIVTGNDKKYLHNENLNNAFKKVVRGKNIKRYHSLIAEEYLNYDKDALLRARDEAIFLSDEKLIMQMINIVFVLTYDNNQFYNLGTTYALTKKNNDINLKYLLSILNSKLISYYYIKKFTNESSLTNAISTKNLFKIPIKLSDKADSFIFEVNNILEINANLQSVNIKLQTYLKQKFQLEKLSKKLQNWHTLEFGDFIKELNKAIKANNKSRAKENLEPIPTLTKKDEFEWLDLFEENKQKAQELQTQINQTDAEIDAMVYELYGLSEEEIAIVENS